MYPLFNSVFRPYWCSCIPKIPWNSFTLQLHAVMHKLVTSTTGVSTFDEQVLPAALVQLAVYTNKCMYRYCCSILSCTVCTPRTVLLLKSKNKSIIYIHVSLQMGCVPYKMINLRQKV
jgi:hypothetical protein